MPPIKPEVCAIDGMVVVFLGADYKFLTPEQAQTLVAKLQGSLASIRRNGKRIQREVRRHG